MSKDLENLVEETAENKEEKKRWERKPITAEEIEQVKAGIETLKKLGVSENYAKLLAAAPNWYAEDKTVKEENRKALVDSFDGKLKDYLESEEFVTEHARFSGITKLMAIVGNIVSYNSRRNYIPKDKMVEVSINGEVYTVNKKYMESIRELPKDERRKLLIEHADTKKASTIEEF